jgi:hypothetical protein
LAITELAVTVGLEGEKDVGLTKELPKETTLSPFHAILATELMKGMPLYDWRRYA